VPVPDTGFWQDRSVPLIASRALLRQTERWFVRRGVPLMIADYSFSRHVLPRMLPFLAFVAVTSLLWLLRGDYRPGERFTLLGVVLAVGLGAWWLLTTFGRRLPRFPRRAAVATVAAYAAMPVVVPLLELAVNKKATSPELRADGIADSADNFGAAVTGFFTIFAVLFAVAWLTTTYGVVPLLRRGVRHAVYDMRNTVRLQSRALPMLLFVTLFFFFTGELWQAMDRLSWWRVCAVLTLFAAVTVLAAAGRLREETGRVEQDLSPPRLASACRRTPLAELLMDDVAPGGPLRAVPLSSHQRANLLLVLATRQIVQAFVVGLGLFGFFLVLGLIVVQKETAEQWIGGPAHYSAMLPGVPVALLRNAALLAGFGSMYFAVTSMSDTEHRREFFAPILDEVERTLAVRAVYLTVRDVVQPEQRPTVNSAGGPVGDQAGSQAGSPVGGQAGGQAGG
jgi:Ca2+/Na+ antiporter